MDSIKHYFKLNGLPDIKNSEQFRARVINLDPEMKASFMRLCNEPFNLLFLGDNQPDPQYLSEIIKVLIKLYQEHPEMFPNNNIHDLDLVQTYIGSFLSSILDTSAELLETNPEQAEQIKARAGEEADDIERLKLLVSESNKLSTGAPDLIKQLPVQAINIFDATVASFASCQSILTNLLNENYDLNFKKKSPKKDAFFLVVPDRIRELIPMTLLTINNVRNIDPTSRLYEHRGYMFHLTSDESAMHEIKILWTTAKHLKDPMMILRPE